ncbi:hypothetical protein LCGC14_1452440, partial [marine sediment metagenome]
GEGEPSIYILFIVILTGVGTRGFWSRANVKNRVKNTTRRLRITRLLRKTRKLRILRFCTSEK